MAYEASDWAWTHIRELHLNAGEALVLLRLAWHASEKNGWSCWPGIETLSEDTGRGEKTVRRAITDFEAHGLLRRERQQADDGRGRGRDRLILLVDQSVTMTGRTNNQAVTVTGKNRASSGHLVPTKRSFGPDQAVISSRSSGHFDQAIYREPKRNHKEPKENTEGAVPEFTDLEQEMTRQVIAAFNVEAGTHFTSPPWLDRVVPCLRAHPELTEADLLAVVASAFRKPWWTDQPSPAVFFSSVRQFETQVEGWRGGAAAAAKTSKYDSTTKSVAA